MSFIETITSPIFSPLSSFVSRLIRSPGRFMCENVPCILLLAIFLCFPVTAGFGQLHSFVVSPQIRHFHFYRFMATQSAAISPIDSPSPAGTIRQISAPDFSASFPDLFFHGSSQILLRPDEILPMTITSGFNRSIRIDSMLQDVLLSAPRSFAPPDLLLPPAFRAPPRFLFRTGRSAAAHISFVRAGLSVANVSILKAVHDRSPRPSRMFLRKAFRLRSAPRRSGSEGKKDHVLRAFSARTAIPPRHRHPHHFLNMPEVRTAPSAYP